MEATKTRGRPSDPQKIAMQKVKLLKAAQALLDHYSYSQITIRDIAAKAEVNSAMIKYYFENKEGLFIELLNYVATEHFSDLHLAANEDSPVLTFIKRFSGLLRKKPGFCRLLSEEVLNNDSALTDVFLTQFPCRVAQFLPELIQRETGITDEEKARHAAFHLSSTLVAPFLLRTVRMKAWGISDDVLGSDEWVHQVYQHFLFGFREEHHEKMELSI
ncbi:TetR/AcrR family transcriptional regulator [Marinomonas mediterranea]|jgi:Transcriptional regulator|uniref:Regulatory protein TetR n=1 Tax=Marinomonas mediterranea (strain ATCC 700492 / JCM 21426 / NBRC 103028 / MMB-1) TaxID=717774 RepID=F2K085_MARM1|nr:TetR/AcrR family transcriptional regulator [Marinomonas mediterranea]ADZ93299.1 regulatory protein TetR [Marinomonas mediterranea MMB-1]WCN11189.1 TetR family transcriptional regulator [Marinomonas mediterranea]WCN15251.1 TetR family transcriptional regulator [Marinomonas mediterranea]WCN19297.1 TetR family transcriptional regulator [Marinomonas mediterranea MMB-1]